MYDTASDTETLHGMGDGSSVGLEKWELLLCTVRKWSTVGVGPWIIGEVTAAWCHAFRLT